MGDHFADNLRLYLGEPFRASKDHQKLDWELAEFPFIVYFGCSYIPFTEHACHFVISFSLPKTIS